MDESSVIIIVSIAFALFFVALAAIIIALGNDHTS